MRSTRSARGLAKKYDNLHHKSVGSYLIAYLVEGSMHSAFCSTYLVPEGIGRDGCGTRHPTTTPHIKEIRNTNMRTLREYPWTWDISDPLLLFWVRSDARDSNLLSTAVGSSFSFFSCSSSVDSLYCWLDYYCWCELTSRLSLEWSLKGISVVP